MEKGRQPVPWYYYSKWIANIWRIEVLHNCLGECCNTAKLTSSLSKHLFSVILLFLFRTVSYLDFNPSTSIYNFCTNNTIYLYPHILFFFKSRKDRIICIASVIPILQQHYNHHDNKFFVTNKSFIISSKLLIDLNPIFECFNMLVTWVLHCSARFSCNFAFSCRSNISFSKELVLFSNVARETLIKT